ncbi:MAG: hypothetical protein H0W76_04330 [Pyrinomonadaceae bacterium]|nr:hypothetical protein [Pyrinomonadaceae bacterium]
MILTPLVFVPVFDGLLRAQFINQHADNSAPDFHSPREVGTRNRLMLMHQVKRNAPVYLTRRGTRGNVKIVRVDFSHWK